MKKIRRISPTTLALASALFILFAYLAFDTLQLTGARQGQGSLATLPPSPGAPVAAAPSTKTPPAGPATPVPSLVYSRAAAFDYFILSLSWAPEYCATGGSNDLQECAIGKQLGFVLHGLWPEYNQGYPSNCTLEKLTPEVTARYAGLFPSQSLLIHEWEKHGTCSGLAPAAYLGLAQRLKQSVAIPDALQAPRSPLRLTASQLKQAFLQANPALTAASLELNCAEAGRSLQEVYVCFGRDGSPLACGADIRKDTQKSCPAADFLVRSVQ